MGAYGEAGLKYRKADDNPADGHFTTVGGHRHGEPHRYEVVAPWGPLGYVYKIETNVVGATYISWIAEIEPGRPILDQHGLHSATFYTRAEAAAALVGPVAS